MKPQPDLNKMHSDLFVPQKNEFDAHIKTL